MTLRESIVVPDSFRLVENGLGPETLRDPAVPRNWRGLSADDAYLLSRWVFKSGESLEELHTDVPVGMCPALEVGPADGFFAKYVASLHPLRIDAVVRVNGAWSVMELKADAGYTALGQVLVYQWYAVRTIDVLAGARAVVVTDKVQACIAPVFKDVGVSVVQVGDWPRD